MKHRIILIAVAILFQPLISQTPSPQVGVYLHESMINAFFRTVGPVSGKGKKKNTPYKWTIIDPRIDLEPGNATFRARVKVKAGSFKTEEKTKGIADIQYDPDSNRIRVVIQEAKVKLYFKLFGAKIPIATIDVARYYKPSFEFAGPKPIQDRVDLELPDGSRRTIQIEQIHPNLVIEKDRVAVYSDLKFTRQD
ncbi:MAG: hypothetical protein D6762_07375 [Candidatus Neomarinimicrobiota bacterium]|nr:MAG: hypothetical protein D6762_07375 [Candidatus Neomarinimicrobiota bacterium]